MTFAAQSAQKGQEACREEEAIFGRANHRRVAASKPGCAGRRRVSAGRHFAAELLSLEERVRELQPSEARELKQLRDENTKLKRIVADLSLDKVMLQDVLQKKC